MPFIGIMIGIWIGLPLGILIIAMMGPREIELTVRSRSRNAWREVARLPPTLRSHRRWLGYPTANADTPDNAS